MAGEQCYAILSSDLDGDGPAAILINDETLARIDRVCADINEVLADVFEQLLLEAGLVESLVVSEGS